MNSEKLHTVRSLISRHSRGEGLSEMELVGLWRWAQELDIGGLVNPEEYYGPREAWFVEAREADGRISEERGR